MLEQQDCIGVQTKYWFWILGVLVTVAVVAAIVSSYKEAPVYSSKVESSPQGGRLQTIASTQCPYCPGANDAQGRCNVRGCPLYSPNFGRPVNSPNLQIQNIASVRCPYCPGLLDWQGRCNLEACPIYSPNWGQGSNSEGIPIKKVLIRELALEVGSSEGKNSVIIQSIYIGGNAEKAGLKAGDRIVRFNGRKVKNVKQFQFIVARAAPESRVTIKVIRDGEKVKSTVMVGEGEMEGATPPLATNAP